VPVNRGPSLAATSGAIAAAVIADATARQERDEAAQRSRELGVPRSDAAPLVPNALTPER
jgi:hypothetical protein